MVEVTAGGQQEDSMSEDIDIMQLQKYLECSICLDIFTNPRLLTCRHQFCKECLDEIIVFNEDGSAIINCPLKCSKPTILNQYQTTNDLGGSYEFTGMLEILRTDKIKPGVPLCSFTKDCRNEVSLYCCEVAMCRQCETNHNLFTQCRRHYGKTNVTFDENEEKLKVMCEEHRTKCTHICSDNTFLCIYCMNRKHRHHERNIIEYEVARIKQSLKKDTNLKQKIDDVSTVTKADISYSKVELERTLKEKKVRCLSKYIEFLNSEEDKIKKEFENLSGTHISQYDIAGNCSSNEDVDMLVRRNSVTENLSVKLSKSPISYLSLSLSSDTDFQDKTPLGRLVVANDNEAVPLHRYSFISSFDAHFDQIKDFENISRRLTRDLDALLPPTTKKDNEYYSAAKGAESSSRRCNKKLVCKAPRPNTYNNISMNDIMHFFQCKKTSTLKSLIKTCPWIVEMQTKSSGDYLAHLAVKHDNLEVLKAIFKHDLARYDVKNGHGQTLLTLATYLKIYSPPELCFNWLVEEYPELINIGDNKGKNPLHYAARSSSVETLKYLLEHGADIGKKDLEGHNALHHALLHGRDDCLKILKKEMMERKQKTKGI